MRITAGHDSPPGDPGGRGRAARAILRGLARTRTRWLFALTLALHVAVLAARDAPLVRTENLRAGITLATKGYLGDPFSAPTGSTGHLAPAYPALVAAVHRWTGEEERTATVLALVAAVVSALSAALLVPLARRMRLPRSAGVLAALAWAFPFYTWIELSAEHETVFTTAAVLLVLTLVFDRIGRARLDGPDGAMLGAASGVGAYFSPLIPPMAVLSLGAAWLARRHALRIAPRAVVAFALVFVAAVTPYTIRNWAVLGAPFFMRDNLGLELAVSNGDVADPTAEKNLEDGAGMTRHPFLDTAEAVRVRALGEVAYNRGRLHEAIAWIRTHQTSFASLTIRRASYLVLPYSKRPHQRAHAAALSLGCLVGLVWLWRSGSRMIAAAVAGALAGYQGIYLFVQHDIRYVYPMMWLQSLVAASLAVAWVRADWRPGVVWRRQPGRLSRSEVPR